MERLFFIILLLSAYVPVAPAVKDGRIGVKHVQLTPLNATREEWAHFLSETLDKDLGAWRAQQRGVPLRASAVLELQAQMKQHNFPSVHVLVVVRNNTIYLPGRPYAFNAYMPEMLNLQLTAWLRRMEQALVRQQLSLPDVAFVLNVEDNRPRWCGPARNCSAPLISLRKTLGETDAADSDILIPGMMRVPRNFTYYYYPWEVKTDLGIFRGLPQCSHWYINKYKKDDACPRLYLSYRSFLDKRANNMTYFDIGLAGEGFKTPRIGGQVPEQYAVREDIPPVPFLPMADHATYKWLVGLEGITSSDRLAQLFHFNSVVLMQRSPFIDWFDRALREGEHVVKFWNDTTMDDLYDVIAAVRQREARDPSWPHRMLHSAQTFALKFLSFPGRLRFIRSALEGYRSLFVPEEMDALVMRLSQPRG